MGYRTDLVKETFLTLTAPCNLTISSTLRSLLFSFRSFSFSVMKRSAELKGKTIHNVNVRGKRGNIVQVYPAVEYDFVPNTLEMTSGQYVHFQ